MEGVSLELEDVHRITPLISHACFLSQQTGSDLHAAAVYLREERCAAQHDTDGPHPHCLQDPRYHNLVPRSGIQYKKKLYFIYMLDVPFSVRFI